MASSLHTEKRSASPPAKMSAEWTVPYLLRYAAREYGDRTFLQIVGGSSQSYAEVHRSAMKMAAKLHYLGVRPQDKVLIMLTNGLEAIHGWFGSNLLNAVDVSINTGFRGKSLEHAVNLSGAKVMLTSSSYIKVIEQSAGNLPGLEFVVLIDDGPLESSALTQAGIRVLRYLTLDDSNLSSSEYLVNPWDVGSVIYTSGTSGPAKGVQMPQGQITLLAKLSAAKMALCAQDIFFCFYPLYHMAGKFMSVLATLSVGGKLVLDAGFSPELWLERIRTYGATVTAAHGPMLEMVFALPPTPSDRDHKLRLIRTSPFPKRIATEFEARFKVKGLENWGMTEIGVPCWTPLDEPLRVGSCGRIDKDWYEFAVVDPVTDAVLSTGQVGEFVVRPKQPWTVTLGYLGMPEMTVETWRNLWFHTGDCGRIDAEGYVYFIDRAKERIRRRAENISASDIESAALCHHCVADAAAVGVPSEFESDDDIKLCVVPRPNATLTPETLLRFLVQQLPHYMVPRYVQFFDKLPRTATGKLQRTTLKLVAADDEIWDRKSAGIALRDLLN